MPRPIQIDDLTRGDHYDLTTADTCWYYGEYIAGAGYAAGEWNNRITNLKISEALRQSNPNRYRWKIAAENQCASYLAETFENSDLTNVLFVPIPPSKAAGHPEYDPRLTRILGAASTTLNGRLVYREIISQINSTDAVHANATIARPRPDDLIRNYQINLQGIDRNLVRCIVIFDDVVTVGAHYAAAKRLLAAHFPNAQIIGMFIARRALPRAAEDLETIL